ncbi:MAG: (Fe-S)-binding protein [Archaeoglobales archaeon]|nr:MAG: (Fe-S)-binding protein [Archaeoglobales archaeon]
MVEVLSESYQNKFGYEGLTRCYQCGNCTAICPVSDGRFPRRLIAHLRWGRIERFDEVWLCLQCKLCDEFCPRDTNPSLAMQTLKRISVENGSVPPHIGEFLMNVYRRRNPWGHSRMKRGEWMKDLNVPTVKDCEFDWLWFVGCANSFDSRVLGVTEKIARILNELEISYAVLGRDEGCCGNDVKRIGEDGLFELLMEENFKVFKRYGVERIITHSPHCYNTFKNDYNIEVKLFLELLHDFINDGSVELKHEFKKVVTYHDSCFLGRYNNIYELPREILRSVPGLKLVEMRSNRRTSICCGGGAGNIAVGYQGKVQPSILRVKEALDVNADVLAVACPFCKIMLEEASKSVNCNLKVLDVVDIVYHSMYGEGL